MLLKVQAKHFFFFQNGETPAHVAASNGHAEFLGVLIAASADVNLQNKVFRIALSSAFSGCISFPR